jgi:8-oxo-dGTP pyrophosphatase MutT (NUDIX family)
MKHYTPKVCPVLLRQRREQWQILAFRHPLAGTQLIKGTLEPGELPEVGVLRELAEESGIGHAAVVEKIGELVIEEAAQQWHIFLCYSSDPLPEEWEFFTTDGGGHLFHYFWHPLGTAPDESWHLNYQTALAFIRAWHDKKSIKELK